MNRYARGLCWLSLLFAMSLGQEQKVPAVAIKDKIVEVGAPLQIVAETDVRDFNWLEGGRYLVYLREPEPERESYLPVKGNPSLFQRKRQNALYLYDATARRTTLIHRDNIDFWAIALNGRAILYAVGEQTLRRDDPEQPPTAVVSERTTLYLRLPFQSQPKTVLQLNEGVYRLDPSPEGRYLLIISHATAQILDLQTGRTVRSFESPFRTGHWVSETVLYLVRQQGGGNDYFSYDVRTDRLQPISEETYGQALVKVAERFQSALRKATRHLQLQPKIIPTEAPISAAQLYLYSSDAQTDRLRRTAVAHDSDSWFYALAPDESGVAYLSWRGQLFYVPLHKRDPRTLHERLACGQQPTADEIRQHYLSNAKQIALAAIMYCQDYDELFPPNNDVIEVLMPYLKNSELFQDAFTGQVIFTYLLDGHSLANIERPADTPLGRLDWGDSDWVVVIYADGHAKLERRR